MSKSEKALNTSAQCPKSGGSARNGEFFTSVVVDIPEKKQDLVKSIYEINVIDTSTKVAVKIVDVLGNEFIEVKEI